MGNLAFKDGAYTVIDSTVALTDQEISTLLALDKSEEIVTLLKEQFILLSDEQQVAVASYLRKKDAVLASSGKDGKSGKTAAERMNAPASKKVYGIITSVNSIEPKLGQKEGVTAYVIDLHGGDLISHQVPSGWEVHPVGSHVGVSMRSLIAYETTYWSDRLEEYVYHDVTRDEPVGALLACTAESYAAKTAPTPPPSASSVNTRRAKSLYRKIALCEAGIDFTDLDIDATWERIDSLKLSDSQMDTICDQVDRQVTKLLEESEQDED